MEPVGEDMVPDGEDTVLEPVGEDMEPDGQEEDGDNNLGGEDNN